MSAAVAIDHAPPASARPHVAFWATAGAVVTVLGLWSGAPWPPVRVGPDWALPVVVVGGLVLSSVSVRIPLARGATTHHTLSEAAILPAVVLLHPGWAIVVAVLGEATCSAILRKHPLKVAFNLGWTAVGTGAAAVTFGLLWNGALTSAVAAAAGLLAIVAYTAVNLVALYLVASAVSDRTALEVARHSVGLNVQQSLAVGSVGLLATILLVEIPWALPFLALPLMLARSRSEVRRRYELELLDERDRFDRTIAGASDGIVLVDGNGVVRVWNTAAESVTGRPSLVTVGRPAREHLALIDLEGEPIDLEARLGACRASGAPESWWAVIPATARTVVVSASPDAAGRELVLVLRDISRQQELERMREDLVSRVSHELRTPLATTAGFIETTLGRWDQLSDEQRRGLLEVAHRSSRRLTRVVGGLLVRSKIEAAAAAPRPAIVDVPELVRATIDELRDTITLPASVATAGADLLAYVDRDHLQQAVENLVVNADRYGARCIEITITGPSETIVVEVRDHGDGIDPDFIPQLFEPFTQASTGLQRTAEGLGLGLSIVRSLVEANGGRVVYDDAPGGGALFSLHVPRPITTDLRVTQPRAGATT